MMHTAVIRKVTITMGRTSILTDRKKRAALIRAAGCLVSSRAAAGLAGCAPRTVQNLLKIGEGDLACIIHELARLVG